MKTKILSVIFFFISLFFIASCDEEDSRPDCEVDNYGTVIVKNSTGSSIYVDVTWGSSDYNDERKLSNGSQTTYNRVNAGDIKVWGSYTGLDGWKYKSTYLSSCDEVTMTWN
ncbi:MAG: hypothetical protein ACLFVR_08535 [Thiohalospira sp.]